MGGGTLRGLSAMFLRFGFSGHPQTGEPIDREILAAGLRVDPALATAAALADLHLKPQPAPQGYWVFNRAAAGVHRWGQTLVTFKGYNRNVWSSEIYARDNRYGRYQSHGTHWIQNGQGDAASGFLEAGWDWNRPPGATTAHLPLDLLESPRPGTLMDRSREAFAGSGHLGHRAGLFAVRIFDHHLPGSRGLVARKSAFAIENRIIALGSGIAQPEGEHPVETTLFQNALADLDLKHREADLPQAGSFLTSDRGWTALDAVGNGYFVHADQTVRVTRQIQHSRHNKTRQPTEGEFLTAGLDHGIRPEGARYAYAILLETDAPALEAFAQRMRSDDPVYRILRHEPAVHAVEDRAAGLWAAACFEGKVSLELRPDLHVQVDRPCLLLLKPLPQGQLHLSVTDPDLNLQEGASVPVRVELKLSGRWELAEGARAHVQPDEADTRLIVTVSDGLTQELVLAPAR